MRVVLKCSKCGKPLEPAALPKDSGKLWCPLCADLKDANGVNVGTPTVSEFTASLANKAIEVLDTPKGSTKCFNVTVGEVSFVSFGRVDLTIGQTKVTIT